MKKHAGVIGDAIKDGTLSRLSLKWFGFDLTPKE